VIDAYIMRLARRRIGPAAVAVALGLASFGASGASATGVPCSGANIMGMGSALQADAHWSLWAPGFTATQCTGPGAPQAFYTTASSGIGLSNWGAFGGSADPAYAFIGTDDAPNATQRSNIQRSVASGGTGSTVLTLPVAQHPVTIVANLPSGCDLTGVTAANLEAVFRGTASPPTWAAMGATGASCGVSPTRVVHAESTNATWVLKGYMKRANGASFCASSGPYTWAGLQTTFNNNSWCADAGNLLRSRLNGTGSPGTGVDDADEVATVVDNDNSIGYVAQHAYNDMLTNTRILGIRDRPLSRFELPSTGSGSNCTTASGAYTDAGGALPSASGDWSNVSFSNPGLTYPICALTYDLALVDYQPLLGSGSPGTSVGQTVCDYLSYIIGAAGQGAIAGTEYGVLPSDVRARAVAGLGAC
jgi:ABC-type phosphate transport system substrate-binding protein